MPAGQRRPGTLLIDTGGQGVERITEKGVVANGVAYDVDRIVYASGFEVSTDYVARAGFASTLPTSCPRARSLRRPRAAPLDYFAAPP